MSQTRHTQEGHKRSKPPVAERRPTKVAGEKDYYYWMREQAPEGGPTAEVLHYLQEENAYTAQAMRPTENLQRKLRHEIIGHIREDDETVPVLDHGYWYYSRTVKGKQYGLHYRIKDGPNAVEECILDENEIAGDDAFSLGELAVSPDQKIMAYSTDTAGKESYTLHFKNLSTGEELSDVIENTSGNVVWAEDNQTVFYVTRDDKHRPYRVYRHALGSGKPAALIFEEKDERYFVGVASSRDRHFIAIVSESKESSEVRMVPAQTPTAEANIAVPRKDFHKYSVYGHGAEHIVVSDKDGRDYGIYQVPTDGHSEEAWKVLIPPVPGQTIEDVAVFAEYMVFTRRVGGRPRLFVCDFSTGQPRELTVPEEYQDVWIGDNPDYNTTKVRIGYTPMLLPAALIECDLRTGEPRMLKRKEVPNYDPERFETKKVFAKAKDGTSIPISLAYKKGTLFDGTAPLVLYGYGSYGMSIDGWFSATRLPLLERGVIFAIAHVRGGGEMGRGAWHDDGKMLNKRNTFDDFIACTEFLGQSGIADRKRIIAEGRSAGGLLMGVVANERPDLFRGIVMGVPFVDVLSTMSDDSIPLTISEKEDWGDPADPTYRKYIKGYSPVDNIKRQKYPAILVTGGVNDTRVAYWEPAKWVAKLRANAKPTSGPLLLKTELAQGHFGSSGMYSSSRRGGLYARIHFVHSRNERNRSNEHLTKRFFRVTFWPATEFDV